MSSKLYCKWFIFSSRALLEVLNDNEQKTDPGNTVLETFLLRLSRPLHCLIHLEAPLQGLGISLEKLRSKQMDGDSVQNVPLTFGDFSDPSSTCCVDLSQCCFIAADVCRWQRCSLGSELGELGAFSLWREISPRYGQSLIEGWEKNADVRLGEFPTICPLDRACASGKMGYRVYSPGLSPYKLSLVRFGCKNCAPHIASEGLCPSVRAHRGRGKLNLWAFFKGQKEEKKYWHCQGYSSLYKRHE